MNERQSFHRLLHTISVVIAISGGLIGCAPAVQNITVRSSKPLAVAPDKATIVVIQPTTRFGSLSILDSRGQLVAQLNDRSYVQIQVPPGPVRLYGVVEKQYSWADRIEGSVMPGRTYFATVSLRYGGIAMRALNTRSADNRWSQKDQFLAKTPQIEMDARRVALARTELGDPTPIMEAADNYVGKLDGAHRAERSIQPEDGI